MADLLYPFALVARKALVMEKSARTEKLALVDTLAAIELHESCNDIDHILKFVLPRALAQYARAEEERTNGGATVELEQLLRLEHESEREVGTGIIGGADLTTEKLLEGQAIDKKAEVDKRDSKLADVLYEAHGRSVAFVLSYLSNLVQQFGPEVSTSVVDRLKSRIPEFDEEDWWVAYNRFRETVGEIVTVLKGVQISSASTNSSSTHQHEVAQLRELGNNLMSNRAYPQAIAVYTEAIQKCRAVKTAAAAPLPQLLTNRAIAYMGLNCFFEAVTDLNLALYVDNEFIPAWSQIGYCHLYMGLLLLSLKCYLRALEMYTKRDTEETSDDSIMPQFVQRLIQSVVLCEKRARQQREPLDGINQVVGEVKKIASRLQSKALDVDKAYYEYGYTFPSNDTFVLVAGDANRTNPSILNQDTAQDLLASTSIEATAVPMTFETRIPRPTTAGNNTNGGPVATAAALAAAAAATASGSPPTTTGTPTTTPGAGPIRFGAPPIVSRLSGLNPMGRFQQPSGPPRFNDTSSTPGAAMPGQLPEGIFERHQALVERSRALHADAIRRTSAQPSTEREGRTVELRGGNAAATLLRDFVPGVPEHLGGFTRVGNSQTFTGPGGAVVNVRQGGTLESSVTPLPVPFGDTLDALDDTDMPPVDLD